MILILIPIQRNKLNLMASKNWILKNIIGLLLILFKVDDGTGALFFQKESLYLGTCLIIYR